MNVQIITMPSGERMAIMPESEYLVLLDDAEMAHDIAAIELFKLRLASGDEELIPAAVVNALLDGENAIRVWREHRGLSVKALAELAGVAPAYLSQIETGKREGTVSTLSKIAKGLGVTIDDLVS